MSPLPNMTSQQFLAAAQQVADRYPQCVLVKNQVGNLSIDIDGEYMGWVDLRYGEVTIFADEDDEDDGNLVGERL